MDIKLNRTNSSAIGTHTTAPRSNINSTEKKNSNADDATVKKLLSQKVEVRQPVTSIEEARMLTSDIADTAGLNSNTDSDRESFIRASTGSLDPNRVQALLSEEQ